MPPRTPGSRSAKGNRPPRSTDSPDIAPDSLVASSGAQIAGANSGAVTPDRSETASTSKRGRPSLEEAQRLPQRILEAGWEVLREHGFDAFTFDRVARHAHIGKATIYTRFGCKREFFDAL
ncbi:MAG: helix-turn-helix domain containing protein, partial [Novosphingobium sp.]|nr:helix-turn-helix domain containing protein [Novosphingobium sp.]